MIDGRALVKDFESSEAGQALKAKGFRAEHQGEGVVNFEAVRDGVRLTVVASGCDFGPRRLGEPVDVLKSDAADLSTAPGERGEDRFPTVTAFLATL
jgi:hypothetical protein